MKRSPLARKTPLKRTGWIRRTSGSSPRPRARRRPRDGRSSTYLRWVRTLPCTVDGCFGESQAAHTGEHGLAIKAPDFSAIPLCAAHHLWEFDGSYHRLGREAFELQYRLSIAAVVASLQALWRER